MIDIQILREDSESIKKAVVDKGFDSSIVDHALKLDVEKRKLMGEVQELQAGRNKAAKEKNIEKGKEIKIKLQEIEPKLSKLDEEFQEIFSQIPNPALDNVPRGKGEKDNVEVRKWGEPRKFDFEPKDHLEIGKNLGILDFETGAKVTGSQFYFLYGDGALLELALVSFAMELLSKEGFVPVITPDLAKSRFYLGTGYSPKGNEAQTYTIEGEDLGLIATAEVTLAGKHADEIIPEKNLPL
jgi:seryl-tRNA synthetase